MAELIYVYATGGVVVTYFLVQCLSRRLDPFAPVWLFLVGYTQLYVVQSLSYHTWAVGVRGAEVVAATNWRALWALCWFLAVYHLNPGRLLAAALPRPPRAWSPLVVAGLAPPLILWGLFCSSMHMRAGYETEAALSPETAIFASFPFVMMVAAIMLIVTGRNLGAPRPPSRWPAWPPRPCMSSSGCSTASGPHR